MNKVGLFVLVLASILTVEGYAQGVTVYTPGYVLMADVDTKVPRVERDAKKKHEKAIAEAKRKQEEQQKRLKLEAKRKKEREQAKQKEIARLKKQYEKKLEMVKKEMELKIKAAERSN